MGLLQDICERLLREKTADYSQWTIVFPNKRAGLFFKRLLSQQINHPIWSPEILSINEVFERHCPYLICDKFTLIYKLYNIIGKYYTENESFEQFFFWGETLLADFDEIDKFLVDPKHLFQDLSYIKDLESSLSHLTENQKELIKKYWKSFEGVLTKEQEKTLSVWKILGSVYDDFVSQLEEKDMAYSGMIRRWVIDNLDNGVEPQFDNIIFGGFNALSVTEEKLICWYKQNLNCELFWDADDYYLKDDQQEAGEFLRHYKNSHPILSQTFKASYSSDGFSGKSIDVIECSTDAGQAQEVGNVLEQLISQGMDPEEIAVVLPEESLLLPVLNTIPEKVESLNITMGYPLKNSLTYSFLLALLELQKDEQRGKSNAFYYKNVFKILSHPFIFDRSDNFARELIARIKKENILFVNPKMLHSNNEELKTVFQRVGGTVRLIDYLLNNLLSVAAGIEESSLESEFILHFYKLLNNLKDLFIANPIDVNYNAFIRLINHAIYRERLPFEGEPLKGLQIMGFMETRNLGFKHIILLSASEGVMPPARQEVSFIPHSIRKAYSLPTIDHSDSIYSYLFYRLIHNCKNITVLFNGNSERGRTGELSRFIRQLMVETDFNINIKSQDVKIYPVNTVGIAVKKNSEILDKLSEYIVKGDQPVKRLSPSAINTYLDCSLKFFFRYVLNIYEDEEVEEDIHERELGLLFHRVMELIYSEFSQAKNQKVDQTAIQNKMKEVDHFLERAFSEYYHFDDPKDFLLSGQSELAYGIIKELVLQVLTIDEKYAPFNILGLEADESKGYTLDFEIETGNEPVKVGLKGIIDRIDQQNGKTRILDYKTGKDVREFSDIPSLFDPENKKRNKAVFQTFLYCLIFLKAHPDTTDQLQMGLYNLRDIFSDNFNVLIRLKDKDARPVEDVKPFLEEYKNELKSLLEKIFNPDIDFVQTDDLMKCKFCPYVDICNREEK